MLAALLPGYTAIRGRGRRPAGRRRHAPALRQHDPVAAAGAAGVPPPAALSRPIPACRHAAHRGRGRASSAPFGDVRVITTHLEYYSQRKRAAQVEALRAIYAEGHALRARRAHRSWTTTGPFQTYLRPGATRSSPATSTSSPTIRCTRGWWRRSTTARRRLRDAWAASRIPARRTRRRSRSTKRTFRAAGAPLRLHFRERGSRPARVGGSRRPRDAGVGPPAGDPDARLSRRLGVCRAKRSADPPTGVRPRAASPSSSSHARRSGRASHQERLARRATSCCCRSISAARFARSAAARGFQRVVPPRARRHAVAAPRRAPGRDRWRAPMRRIEVAHDFFVVRVHPLVAIGEHRHARRRCRRAARPRRLP